MTTGWSACSPSRAAERAAAGTLPALAGRAAPSTLNGGPLADDVAMSAESGASLASGAVEPRGRGPCAARVPALAAPSACCWPCSRWAPRRWPRRTTGTTSTRCSTRPAPLRLSGEQLVHGAGRPGDRHPRVRAQRRPRRPRPRTARGRERRGAASPRPGPLLADDAGDSGAARRAERAATRGARRGGPVITATRDQGTEAGQAAAQPGRRARQQFDEVRAPSLPAAADPRGAQRGRRRRQAGSETRWSSC